MFNKGQLAGLMKQAQTMVAAAFNAAVRKAEDTSQEKMAKISAGMPGLPGGMKFPF